MIAGAKKNPEELEPCAHTAGVNKEWCGHFRKDFLKRLNINIDLSRDPRFCSQVYTQEKQKYIAGKDLYTNVHRAIISNS